MVGKTHENAWGRACPTKSSRWCCTAGPVGCSGRESTIAVGVTVCGQDESVNTCGYGAPDHTCPARSLSGSRPEGRSEERLVPADGAPPSGGFVESSPKTGCELGRRRAGSARVGTGDPAREARSGPLQSVPIGGVGALRNRSRSRNKPTVRRNMGRKCPRRDRTGPVPIASGIHPLDLRKWPDSRRGAASGTGALPAAEGADASDSGRQGGESPDQSADAHTVGRVDSSQQPAHHVGDAVTRSQQTPFRRTGARPGSGPGAAQDPGAVRPSGAARPSLTGRDRTAALPVGGSGFRKDCSDGAVAALGTAVGLGALRAPVDATAAREGRGSVLTVDPASCVGAGGPEVDQVVTGRAHRTWSVPVGRHLRVRTSGARPAASGADCRSAARSAGRRSAGGKAPTA